MESFRESLPHKIGVLIDWKAPALTRIFTEMLEFAFQNALDTGVIDRPVALVVREVLGLPTGRSHDVLEAWKDLAAEGVLAVIGPHTSENALVVRDHIENVGHIPSIGWPGSDAWQGHWTYGLNQGSFPEEPALMANFLAHRGARTVAVLVETSVTGQGYLPFFRRAARTEGLTIVETVEISPVSTDMTAAAERLHAAGADAIAYLGFGIAINAFNRACEEKGWDPLRIATVGMLLTPFMPEGMRGARGFYGLDLYDERNEVGQNVIAGFAARYGYRPDNYYAVNVYDLGNIIAHALGDAHPVSPAGVRAALDRIKWLPAASGGPGLMISYGPMVRSGWTGSNYILVRRILDEDGDLFGKLPSEFAHSMMPRVLGL
ncbi:hypothetical protein BH10PSE13_BH10PSE13_16820 [soil metagenome]